LLSFWFPWKHDIEAQADRGLVKPLNIKKKMKISDILSLDGFRNNVRKLSKVEDDNESENDIRKCAFAIIC